MAGPQQRQRGHARDCLPVRLGISLPYERPDGGAPTAAQLAARARLIEDIGFDLIAQGDHVGSARRATPDVLTWLTAAASATTRVELASTIIQAPLRHAGELAHRLMNVHAVSGGRFLAGLGAGSSRADYVNVGVDFERRFKSLGEALPIIKEICQTGRSDDRVFYRWPNVPSGPPI